MRKEILVSVKGEINLLNKVWNRPDKIKIKFLGDRFRLFFLEDSLTEFYKLKPILDRLKIDQKIDITTYYKAYDFEKLDLEMSDLLWLHVIWYPGLEIITKNPIKSYRCISCGFVHSVREPIYKISLRSNNVPKAQIIAVDSQILFHCDLIEKLEHKGIDDSLKYVPCSIQVTRGPIIETYFWVYSMVDLGLPVGEIDFGNNCPECGIPKLIENRSFIDAFKREKWNKNDFCTSSYYGEDFLYVSQKIYRFINELPVHIKGDIIFEPIELI